MLRLPTLRPWLDCLAVFRGLVWSLTETRRYWPFCTTLASKHFPSSLSSAWPVRAPRNVGFACILLSGADNSTHFPQSCYLRLVASWFSAHSISLQVFQVPRKKILPSAGSLKKPVKSFECWGFGVYFFIYSLFRIMMSKMGSRDMFGLVSLPATQPLKKTFVCFCVMQKWIRHACTFEHARYVSASLQPAVRQSETINGRNPCMLEDTNQNNHVHRMFDVAKMRWQVAVNKQCNYACELACCVRLLLCYTLKGISKPAMGNNAAEDQRVHSSM